MSEYLKIENFGPISEAELIDIKPLTLFIGESGSGKSTIMKVLSLFRWMYKRINLRSFIKHSKIKNTKIGFKTLPLFKVSGLLEYLLPDSVITYRNGPYEIIMKNKQTTARFVVARQHLSLEKIVFISDKRSIIPDLLGSAVDRHKDNYYLQDTLENFRTACKQTSELNLNFLGVNFAVRKQKNGTHAFNIIGNGINGDFNIKLSNASSGIQTSTPVGLITDYYATKYNLEDSLNGALFRYFADTDNLKSFRAGMNVGEFPYRRVHIFIEEPELSLYPVNQIELVDFLIERCFLTRHDYDMTLMMATHSPYIVNYINLLFARYGKQSDALNISADSVDVYLVENGTIINLKIKDDQGNPLIDTTRLSDPITDIYDEYDRYNG
ncbi:MAG: AAA family ATPase [Muribaculaceae bacterium]|nr:AAA family ATPase [Muribaculaceae bacterium]